MCETSHVSRGAARASAAQSGLPRSAQQAPEETWEVSHIGGDRFAANVLALPSGHYYGRLEPEDAAGFTAALHDGRLDLGHLRGRTAYPFAVQAAEVHLRRHLDESRADAVRLLTSSRSAAPGQDPETTAVFEVDGAVDGEVDGADGGGRWSVQVRSVHGEERLLTCRASSAGRGLGHQVVGLTPL